MKVGNCKPHKSRTSMTTDQFYNKLEDKGIKKHDFVRMVSLMFFAADLADSLSLEIEDIMKPYGCLESPLKSNIKTIRKCASNVVYYCDKSLTSDRQCDFGTDAERFKKLAYGWANLNNEKPFLFSDLERMLKAKTNNGLKVMTFSQMVDEINKFGIELKAVEP